ncbi:GAF domain-containing protein [Deinococcus hopiensis]|uniref:histidine kinase n=1 Tax=Deinococcus hopiensis KR-140 TaxID=695939 RepID=A0A1W1UVV9_9DEIO|nr:GAF domain-containing protein [Deinococcus hopiensis]SMB85223.1 Bacteriophytochrome (light-regulated signal transduction histidine kinase) [Deinococcus hopiensis KR-140]
MAEPQAQTLFSDELHAVGHALSPIQPQEVVTDIILRPAISSLGAVAGAVLLINAMQDRLELITRQGYEQNAKTIWQDGPLDRHVPAIDVIQKQEPLFFKDAETLKQHYPQLEQDTGAISPLGSAILPILLNGRSLGVLVLDFHEPHFFTSAERQFLVTLALQCAIALDRTTQHARLLQQQQQQVDVLESINDGFYAVDETWRFIYVNRRAEELWHRHREDLLGKVIWEEFPEIVGSEPYQAHFQAVQERQMVRLEAVSPVLNSWVSINIFPTTHGLSVYFSDISQRKADEIKEREFTQTLERQVSERTRDLQDLNAELRAYALGITRDLSEPLRRVNAVTALLQRRLEGRLDQRHERLFQQVREEARGVGERLDELRHLAVLERRELREEPLPLAQLIVQVRSDLEPLLKRRKVKWVIGTLPVVLGDALLLRQVFAELLLVTLDATTERVQAVIEIDGEARGENVLVWVKHNGLGLTAEQAQGLFNVFQVPQGQLGTGERIGLANVRRIVTRHGGQVWAEGNREGEMGASLLVALPNRLGELGQA